MGGGGSASRVNVELFFLLLSEDAATEAVVSAVLAAVAAPELLEAAAEPEVTLASSPATDTARI